MDEQQKDIVLISGEVCEIIQKDGNHCQVRVLCKPEYLLFECDSGSEFHLGDKVLLNLKYEAKNILPITT